MFIKETKDLLTFDTHEAKMGTKALDSAIPNAGSITFRCFL